MAPFFNALLGALLIFLMGTNVFAGQSVSIAEKASLQAAMQQHIDRSLVNDSYLHFDMKSGNIRKLYPLKAHSEILKMGPYFVLCSDFRDKSSNAVNVDFYIARSNRSYVVFHSAVDDRKRLAALMKKGKVQRVD